MDFCPASPLCHSGEGLPRQRQHVAKVRLCLQTYPPPGPVRSNLPKHDAFVHPGIYDKRSIGSGSPRQPAEDRPLKRDPKRDPNLENYTYGARPSPHLSRRHVKPQSTQHVHGSHKRNPTTKEQVRRSTPGHRGRGDLNETNPNCDGCLHAFAVQSVVPTRC